MNLEFWYMFPVSILIATIAMASGVGGATFFSPIFILALGLPPEIAIGTGLMTEVFGFASGLFGYSRKRLIDFRLGLALITATIPMALLGSWLANLIAADLLKTILGTGLFAIAMSFLRTPHLEDVARNDKAISDEYGGEKAETCLTTAEGERICYTVCNKREGAFIAGVGGLFIGLISTGLGELNGYFLLQRCRVPSKISVATSVFVVAVTALTAATGHFVQFVQTGGEALRTVLSLVIFTIPGVIIGGQIGPAVAARIPHRVLEQTMGVLFILIAVLTLGEVIF